VQCDICGCFIISTTDLCLQQVNIKTIELPAGYEQGAHWCLRFHTYIWIVSDDPLFSNWKQTSANSSVVQPRTRINGSEFRKRVLPSCSLWDL